MTDTNTAEREALMDLIDAYAEARHVGGCHTYNAKTAEARAKVVASLAASAGSEPVIGWHAFPHYLQHPDGRLLRTASDLLARHGYTGCAEPLRAMSDALLSTHPSPPEGMAGWTKASEQLPPCRDNQLYIGVNSAGFAGVFNAVTSIAGNVYCHYETAEESIDVLGDLAIWQPFNPPLPASEAKEL